MTAEKKTSAAKSAKKSAKTSEKTIAPKAKKTGRFLGWQKTPITQASFGRSTKGGSKNTRFGLLNSTGTVQSLEPTYYLIDASEAPVGRIATVAATILMGKHRSTFSPGKGSGDSVILINADKAYFTSDKDEKKIYYWHTGYMGGLKSETAKKALKRRPDEVLWMAVQGMLPKNKLSRYQLSHLKIYTGTEHPHKAQKPITIKAAENPLKKLA